MAVETRLFLDDKMHAWKPDPAMHSASSTAEGSIENLRDTTYANWWKPNDGTSDEWVMVDGGSIGWLGTTGGATIYVAMSYDASGADQTSIGLQQDTSDNPAGAFGTNRASFTLNPFGPTDDYKTFLLTTNGKRYYRLYQFNAARGGGTRTAKIYSWSMFTAVVTVKPNPGASVNSFSPHPANVQANTGVVVSPGGFPFTNRLAAPQQDFHLNVKRIQTKAVWAAIVDAVQDAGCGARNFYMQFSGLKNHALDDFAMVRIQGSRWSAGRPMVDNFDITIPLVTEAHQ
jgi:hypothetical protein